MRFHVRLSDEAFDRNRQALFEAESPPRAAELFAESIVVGLRNPYPDLDVIVRPEGGNARSETRFRILVTMRPVFTAYEKRKDDPCVFA